MADLTNKIVSSNFQKLLQKEGLVVQDGTGSATALQLSGSGNVGINHTPVDGYSLFVDGAVSASSLAVNDGTIFIGQTTMSQNSDGGLTFRDSASKELGSFQGDGFFVLSSSLEDGGNGKPLFSMTRQVGSTQNNNVMQVDLTSLKFIQGTVGQNGQWKFGSTPSGSGYSKDFFINDSYTGNPVPGTSINNPAIYITGSTKNIGLGSFSNSTNKLDISGSLLVSGLNGHITASGNISASGIITAEGLVISDDFSLTDDLTVGGNISASGTAHTIGGFTMGSADGTISRNLNLGGSIIHDGDNDTKIAFTDDTITISTGDVTTTIQEGHITASGNISASGNLQLENNKGLLIGRASDGAQQNVIKVDTNDDVTIGSNNLDEMILITDGGEAVRIKGDGKVGIGTTSPSQLLEVAGNISASGGISSSGTLHISPDVDSVIELGRAKFGSWTSDYMYLSHHDMASNINYALNQTNIGVTSLNAASGRSIQFKIANSEKMTLASDGKVGIGTTSPAGVLQVTSDGSNKFFGVFSASTGAGAYKFYQDSNSHMALYGYNSSGTANVVINTNGASYLKGGNVLIGGSSDNANDKLQVNGSVKTTSHITASGNISSSGNGSFTGTLRADGNVDFNGDLDVAGNINATSLNVTSITSSIVTASIVQTEGSNIFGDTIADTHLFNGHITASGNISSSGTIQSTGNISTNGSITATSADINGNVDIDGGNLTVGTALQLTNGGNFNFGSGLSNGRITWDTGYASLFGLAGNKLRLGSFNTPGVLTISSSTENVMVISASNVGIGATSPQLGKLHISGSGTNANYVSLLQTLGTVTYQKFANKSTGVTSGDGFDIGASGTTAYLINRESANMIFSTNDTERMRIEAAGNVGIGTTSPSKKLEVAGDISSSGDIYLDTNNFIALNNSNNNNFAYIGNQGGSASQLSFMIGGHGNNFTKLKVESQTVSVSDGANLFVSGALEVESHITASGNISGSATSTGSFGAVSIGTASPDPSRELHIYDADGDAHLLIQSNTDNAFITLDSGQDGAGGEESGILFLDNGSAKWEVFKDSGNDFAIHDFTRSGRVLRIADNGNMSLMETGGRVGIGTTVAQNALHLSGSDGTESGIRQSRAGSKIWTQEIDSSGRLQWSYRSTEAGSKTTTFTLDDTNNVGIGTGAPNAKLDVHGDIQLGGSLHLTASAHGHITASNNISASGDVIANTGSFNEINIPADNQFIRLGASQDLQIYHNGSNSFIDDAGTGELRLRGNTRVRLQGMNETNMVSAIQGGGVAVYHNNVEKFLTTAGGINVTGHITASGNISSSIISTGSFGSLSLNNLPTTAIGLLTGSLYTLSGSQLGMSGSHEGNEAKILLVK